MAYIGGEVPTSEVLGKPKNSLISQSLDSHLGAEPTNGDGWGVGWYVGENPAPARYRSVEPMWNDPNIADAARFMRSGCFVSHVRAAIGSAVQRANTHPFRHDRWLFVHNGYIDGWEDVHRELALAVDPRLFHEITGTTDSEIMFLLAVTYGLDADPQGALERMVEKVEEACATAHARDGVQMTVCATNGEALHVVRHATRGQARSLYRSTDVPTLRQLFPDDANLAKLPDDGHLVVSEPLGDMEGAWEEIPQGTYMKVARDGVEAHRFPSVATTDTRVEAAHFATH
jgi:glutamine amidotransferase